MTTTIDTSDEISSVTLRIPASLKRALRTLARREHRSLNAQCEHLLELAVQGNVIDPVRLARSIAVNARSAQLLEQELLALAECEDCDATPASQPQAQADAK